MKRTNPMNVGLYIRLQAPSIIAHERQIIVHHHVDLHDIDSPRDDVRRDEHLFFPVPKSVNDSVSFRRVFSTM